MQTTENTSATDTTATNVRASVNERKFFETMQHIFASSFSALGEVMQNARRAGATAVRFTLDTDKRTLRVSDNGCGIEDFQNLIALCDSGWSEDIQLTDKPFGMGLFSLFFAAQRVVFRSRGKVLTVCLDDIVQRRTLQVVDDTDAARPHMGTVVELQTLNDTLLSERTFFGGGPGSRLREELRLRALGFPIDVYLNGDALPRPHAIDALPGQNTDVGFISFKGVTHQHDEDPTSAVSRMQLYLQGLPIGSLTHENAVVVIHLDSTRFSARMPDRSDLFDPEVHLRAIYKRLNDLVVQYLVKAKSEMDPKDFVGRYWSSCLRNHCEHLLNDIPWIPAGELEALKEVSYLGSNSFDVRRTIAGGISLVSKSDIESGWLRVWRDVPYGVSNCTQVVDIVGLKVMQRLGVFAVSGKVPQGHWLQSVAPSFADLDFSWDVANPQGSMSFYAQLGACTMHLADSVKVHVTCRVDTQFSLTALFDEGWIMVPDDPEQEFEAGDVHVHCFLMQGDRPDHPVDSLSDYKDGDEHFREEWREASAENWEQLESAMRGSTLSDLVNHQLRKMEPLANHQFGQLCLIRTVGKSESPHPNVIDLDRDEFWLLMSKRLDLSQTDAWHHEHANSLKQAFYATSRVGQSDLTD
jgi:hypothetical protein